MPKYPLSTGDSHRKFDGYQYPRVSPVSFLNQDTNDSEGTETITVEKRLVKHKLLCQKCTNKNDGTPTYCYIPPGSRDHRKLSPNQIITWARGIKDKIAPCDVSEPLNTLQLDPLVNRHLPRRAPAKHPLGEIHTHNHIHLDSVNLG